MNSNRALGLMAALCCATSALAEPGRTDGDAVGIPVLLTEAELATARGGQTIVVNNQTLTAITAGNVMGDSIAGDISLADNALSNFNGIGNFVINTGAQNNLQAGMTLTVNVDQ